MIVKKLFCSTLFLLLFVGTICAQTKISGTVVDKSNLLPLQGANISISNLNLSSTSDYQGNFSLNVSEQGEYVLKVTFIGYKTYVEKISCHNSSKLYINIQLDPNIVHINEIEINASKANSNTPIAYSDVDKVQLRNLNTGVDLPKMLDITPSLTFSSDNGSGIGYSDLKIRGTDLTRINVTMNGVPLNNSESHEMYFVDMPDFVSTIDNIQIQRGVGTSVDGSAAFGATVDLKTQGVDNNPYSQISLSGGSSNTLHANVKVGTGLIDNKFSVNVGMSKINSDGYIDRATSDLSSLFLDAGYYGKNFYAKFINITGKEKTYQAWNGASKEQMEIDRQYNPAGEIYQSDSLVGYYNNETDNYLLSSSQLLLGYKIIPELKLNISLHYTYGTGYYENYKNNQKLSSFQNVVGYIMTPDDSTVTKTNLIRRKWVDSDFYGYIYSLNYTKGIIDLILGGGWNYYDGRHYGKVIWAENALVTDINRNWYKNNAYKKDLNQYLKINMALASQINLYVDAQYRRVNYKINGLRDDLFDITQEHTYNFFNPKAGIVWKNNSNRAYFSFAVSHREPSRDDFTDANEGRTPKPESLYDFETGYQHTFNRVKLSASLYYMKYKDQLVLTGEINNTGSAIMVNVDDSYRAGIELESSAEIIHNTLYWNANATFSQNKIKDFTEFIDNWDDGTQVEKYYGTTDISFSPSIIAFNKFQYVFLKNFSLSLMTKYVGKQYMDNSSDERYKINPYLVNDLRLDYNVTLNNLVKNINVFCTLYNFLNEKYETKAWLYRYYSEGVEEYEAGYFPQAGINILAGINIKF